MNDTVFVPSPLSCSPAIGVFDTAASLLFTRSDSCHGTLNDGSSKVGNAWRASVDSNCVNA